jgi:hypothetical protein
MSIATGLITAPVSIDDIRTAIVSSSRDLGTLCTYHSESGGVQTGINKWSRHKPVKHPEIAILTDAQLASVNYGLVVSSATYTDPITAATIDGAYTYQLPTGGTQSPYRQTDFNKYYHYALAPCAGAGDFDIDYRTTTYQFGCAINISGSDNLIGLSEVNSTLMNYYLAMVVRYTVGSNTYVRYACSEDTIGNYGSSITVNLTQGIFQNRESIRNYEYWFCGANTKPSSPDGAGFGVARGYYMPLPFNTAAESGGSITFATYGVTVSIDAHEYTGSVCGYWVTVKNNGTTGSVTVQSATVRMLSGDTYIQQDGFTKTFTTFSVDTVSAGSTEVVIGRANPGLPLPAASFSYSGRESAYYHNCQLEVSITISGQTYTAHVYASYDPDL